MANGRLSKWLQVSVQEDRLTVMTERPGARALGVASVRKLIGDHFVGETTILQAGGYAKAAQAISNSLPTNKRTRSGDLGELLATEYINEATDFVVAIKKLRYKSDRQMPMHGNDIVAVEATQKPVRILKGECKSRAAFSVAAVTEAVEGLDRDGGRPNPSTLGFIMKRLYEDKRDADAELYRDLQCKSLFNRRRAFADDHLPIVVDKSRSEPCAFRQEFELREKVGQAGLRTSANCHLPAVRVRAPRFRDDFKDASEPLRTVVRRHRQSLAAHRIVGGGASISIPDAALAAHWMERARRNSRTH